MTGSSEPGFMQDLVKPFFYSFLIFGLCFAPTELFADRIYLRNGKIVRGKVLRIGVQDYKLKKSDGTTQKIPKHAITKVIFSRGRSEKGYEKFFLRGSLDIARAEYKESLDLIGGNSANARTTHWGVLGLNLSYGYMLVDYLLALHGGLDYKNTILAGSDNIILAGSDNIRYSHLSLRLGVSYYFDLYGFSNLYVNPYVRLPLQSSVQTDPEKFGEEKVSLYEGDLSWGLNLMKEYYGEGLIYGIGFGFGKDSFRLDRKGPVIEESRVKINYLSLILSISYD